jgi:hypothetical protein
MLEQVKARLFTRRTVGGWLFLCGFVLWQVIDGWSNVEFIVGKAPMLRDALVAFFVSPWLPWFLLVGGLGWIAVGSSRLVSGPVSPGIRTAPSKPEERVFVTEDVAFLASLYEGRTSVQADRLAEIYYDKWMRLAGEVSDVTSNLLSFSHVSDKPLVLVGFNEDWATKFEMVKHGDTATVQAKIKLINSTFVIFQDGELVSYGAKASRP